MSIKLLIFAGSSRQESFNKKLALEAYKLAGEQGLEATLLDLRDYPMPIYEGDLEDAAGVPENGRKLKAFFKQHDALLVVSPEYNSSIPPLLKNTIDWVSRKMGEESGKVPYQNKVAALLSASTGSLGGIRSLMHVRQVLTTLGVLVIPEQFGLSRAHEAFDGDGRLLDNQQRQTVASIVQQLASVAARLKSGSDK